jgi:hypothetical protein
MRRASQAKAATETDDRAANVARRTRLKLSKSGPGKTWFTLHAIAAKKDEHAQGVIERTHCAPLIPTASADAGYMALVSHCSSSARSRAGFVNCPQSEARMPGLSA